MTPNAIESLVVFTLDSKKCALTTQTVERVVRAVEVSPCPGSPALVLGLINVRGNIMPVFDLRARFGLPPREVSLDDHLIIARTSSRCVALLANEVYGVTKPDESTLLIGEVVPPEATLFEGILKLSGEIVLIYDLDRVLSPEEEAQLQSALGKL